MGLDISVPVTFEDVLEMLDERIRHQALAHALLADAMAGDSAAKIHTRPGGYGGIHRVRVAYARLKGWPLGHDDDDDDDRETVKMEGAAMRSHLCNHSDADGWYLPDDFTNPVCTRDLSVGSSFGLLHELDELVTSEEGKPTPAWWPQFQAIYIPAVASVVCWQPIQFH